MPANAAMTPSVRNSCSDFYSMLTDLTLTQKRNRATQRQNAWVTQFWAGHLNE